MIKALNVVAKEGVSTDLTAGCRKCDPKDICTLCDVRDMCTTCDSEWCAPFVGDSSY